MTPEELIGATAHALKSPLRSIRQLCEMVSDDYKGRLDPEADELLGMIISSADRAQRTVDSLMIYARLDRSQIHRSEVDCNELVEKLKIDLAGVIEEAKADIVVYTLPDRVPANPQWLRLVFQSLVENGLKFVGEDEYPDITIAGVETDTGFIFSVEDTGIGVPDEYKGQVFEPFKRLHAEEKYAGAGLGLAICQRVVETHGGRIWVEEGSSGKGSKFCFTIAKEV